jgi:DHA1 family bicyclomycin/chloramphenicol resistance-like MFS transporter
MKPTTLPPLWLLMMITLASPFAMNVFNPAMPDVVRAFDSRIDIVQLTLTLYLFTLGFTQLLCGALSDRYGRRPLMIIGMVIHLLGSLLAAIAWDVWILIVGRILQAFGGGATLILIRTMILDATEKSEAGRLLSFIYMAVAIAQMIAPTIGGYLNHYFNWRFIFYFSFVMNLAITLVMLRKLGESTFVFDDAPFSFSGLFKKYCSVLKSPVYLGYALTAGLVTSAYLSFASIMPYIFVDNFKGTSAEYGNWFLFVSGGFFAGSLVASKVGVKFGMDRMIHIGLGIASLAVGILIFSVYTEYLMVGVIFVLMGFVTFGRGFVIPNAQSGAISSLESSKGTANGLMVFMQLTTASLVGQVMPSILSYGMIYVFIAILSLLLLAAIAHYIAKSASLMSR